MTLDEKFTPEGIPIVSGTTRDTTARDYNIRKNDWEYILEKGRIIRKENPEVASYITESAAAMKEMFEKGQLTDGDDIAKQMFFWLTAQYDMIRRQAEAIKLEQDFNSGE